MKKYNIKTGIIGVGRWGVNHVRIFNELSNLIYCSDTDAKKAIQFKEREEYYDLIFTENYQVILSNPEIEAVVVSTPPKTHYQIVKDCLLNNKHVLVEKPF